MLNWNPRANELFLEALERPAGPARNAFLDEACSGDAALRQQIDALLASDEDAGEFLAGPAEESLQDVFDGAGQDEIGTVIGPYTLVEVLGEGGMGVVYRAEQSQPVRRVVALKIVKPGMDMRQVAARFEAERQALALMEHPNIARVIDAGTTETGRPFFVMELVKGVPITKFCDEHEMTPRQRLELFLPVCKAIQHAHQKRIIHRDLKPSNVLVADSDGIAVPKVIDFGVAKAVGSKLTEQTLYTEYGAVIGTVEYMSPEQADLNQVDIDTRSDIYSLGVLLYELLTGSTPLDRSRAKRTSVIELLRMVREDDSPRPSARLSGIDSTSGIAANRGMEPVRLRKLVSGELDWVVMKALEKDRTRRYPTADALANDIENYLSGKPVEACPPSIRYRLGLLVRRHKVAMTAGTIVAASLLGATIFSLRQAAVARSAEDLAEARLASEQQTRQQATATNELLLQMLHTANPSSTKGTNYTVREMLDDFSEQYEDQHKDQPAVEAAIRKTIGDAYIRLSQYDKAEPHIQASVELHRQIYGTESDKYAESLLSLAALTEGSDPVQSTKLAREALQLKRRLGQPEQETIVALSLIARGLRFQGLIVDAENAMKEILTFKPSGIRENELAAEACCTLANLADDRNNASIAEHYARAAMAFRRDARQERHPDNATNYFILGNALKNQQKPAEAVQAYRQAIRLFSDHYGQGDGRVLFVAERLIVLAKQIGNEEAIAEVRDLAEHAWANLPPGVNNLESLGRVFAELELWEKAEECFTRAAQETPKFNSHYRYYVALLQLRAGNRESYLETCQRALAESEGNPMAISDYLRAWTCTLQQDPKISGERILELANRAALTAPDDPRYRQMAAIALYRAGRFDEARLRLREVIESDLAVPSRAIQVLYSQLFLAMAEQRLGHSEEAQRVLREAEDGIDTYCKKDRVDSPEKLPWIVAGTLCQWRDEARQVVLPQAGPEAAVPE